MQETLNKRYQLLRRIGSGGMANVYLARDNVLGREVAVKILKDSSEEFVERFRREALSAAGLNHPNIVAVYDMNEDGERPYLVMEYVPGSDLGDVLRRRGPLPELEALLIGAQVAAALDAAHVRGLIHRDIKPHNVLLTPEGHVKVTDFGIARATGMTPLTRNNAVYGSARYMSPEQVQRQEQDARSDLYALGVLLYELLAGRPPFVGDTPLDIALQHVQTPPQPLDMLRRDLLPVTSAIVMRLLSKDPRDRFQSAREVRAALEDAIRQVEQAQKVLGPGGETTESMRETRVIPLEPGKNSARRRPALAIAASGAGVLLLGGVAFALIHLQGGGSGATPGSSSHHVAIRPSHHRAAPTRTPASTSTETPSPTIRPTQKPVVAAPTHTANKPVPTVTAMPATSLPQPTTTPPPPTGAPVPTATTPSASVAASTGGAATPYDAVVDFYSAVSHHDTARAASYWSPAMQQQYAPISDSIGNRFAHTQYVVVRAWNESANSSQATVGVVVTEVLKPPLPAVVYSGTWRVIHGSGGWLLDQPHLALTGPGGRAESQQQSNGNGHD